MSKADEYFMTNLHFMFDKQSLKILTELEGSSLKDTFSQKYLIEKNNPITKDGTEKEEDARFGSIMKMLEDLFVTFKGGGMTIESLKELIRGKIKDIKPR
jgi:hypothetical protein